MEKGNVDLNHLIKGYILSCQAEVKSLKTVEWYRSFLDRFRRFLKSGNLPTAATIIDKHHIWGFIRYLQSEAKTPRTDKPLSPTTVSGYVRTLPFFHGWNMKSMSPRI